MIYFIQCNGPRGPIKIGQSDDPRGRMAQMQIGCPYELKLLWVHTKNGDPYTEIEIHRMFEHERIRGEWFHPSPSIQDFMLGEMENRIDLATTVLDEDGNSEMFQYCEYADGGFSLQTTTFTVTWDNDSPLIGLDRFCNKQRVHVTSFHEHSDVVV